MTGSRERLELSPEVAQGVLDHALETSPDECCGILLGPAAGQATAFRRATNVHPSRRNRYEIDPENLLEATLQAEQEGLEIVGFYHSHPRGHAAFSDEDRARASWEGAVYLLCSLSPLAFLAGQWTGERFEALEVHVTGGSDPSP